MSDYKPDEAVIAGDSRGLTEWQRMVQGPPLDRIRFFTAWEERAVAAHVEALSSPRRTLQATA